MQVKDEDLDPAKVAFLASLFPQGDLAVATPLTGSDKGKLLKSTYKFPSTIPKPREKDLTHLSDVLGEGEKRLIRSFYEMQQKTREKMRVVLTELYPLINLN